MRACLVSGCQAVHYGLGLCRLHWRRQDEGRIIDELVSKRSPWLPVANYSSAHRRVKKLWGSATQYSCVGSCSNQATSWAYDGTDPTQGYGPQGFGTRSKSPDGGKYWSYFSSYPEFYAPMCVGCHSIRDGGQAREELREYRLWKNTTGLTLANLVDGEYA